jgi:uncharacterized protein (TIGR02265 family)
MSTERVVFGQSMEGMFRALKPHTPLEAAAFLKANVKEDRFYPGYPVEAWLDILDACANSRFAHLDELERYAAVGRLFFLGFSQTMVGSALMAMLKILGPRRTVERMTRNLRTANNFTVGTLTSLAPNHHLVHINFTARPGFYLGLLESGCLRAGAQGLSVTAGETKDLATVYTLKWT